MKSKTPEYIAWSGMRQRCNNPNSQSWRLYGGRGIKICERWSEFDAFLSDMGKKPSAHHSIDRIDVNGCYEPENCRWADSTTQSRNTRRATKSDAGITWSERDQCWSVFISMKNRTIRVGSFKDKDDAIKARAEAVEKHWERNECAPSKSLSGKHGYPGVSFCKQYKNWQAYFYQNRKRKYLGCFQTREEAIECRKSFDSNRTAHGITAQQGGEQ